MVDCPDLSVSGFAIRIPLGKEKCGTQESRPNIGLTAITPSSHSTILESVSGILGDAGAEPPASRSTDLKAKAHPRPIAGRQAYHAWVNPQKRLRFLRFKTKIVGQ